MASFHERTRSIFSELRRRRVFRVAVVYTAVGWVLLQAGEIVVPALGLDDWALTLVLVLIVFGFPIAVLLGWAYDLTPPGIRRTEPLSADPQPEGAAETPALRGEGRADEPPDHPREAVAVLPFSDLGGEEGNKYFADGITEDITTQLSKIGKLRVVSRNSAMRFRPGDRSPAEIAAELGVGTILEGSVRRAGNRVRIVAQLIDTKTDAHLWADTFDRDLTDIFAIQTEVSRKIAEALETEVSPWEKARLDRVPTEDLNAYDLFLKGRFRWAQRTEESLRESLRYFQKATEVDPTYALAFAGMAEAYATLALYNAALPREVMPAAKDAARTALQLDPESGEAYVALGCVEGVFDWRWETAEEHLRCGVRLSPGFPTPHHWYALQNLAPRGRLGEALEALATALDLDPLSAVIRASIGFVHFLQGDYGRAEETLRGVIRTDPDFALAHHFLGETLCRAGNHDEALGAFRESIGIRGANPETLSSVALALAQAGRAGEARTALTDLLARAKREYVSPTRIAQVMAALGDVDGACGYLDRARIVRPTDLVWIKTHPAFGPLRADPRVQALQDEMGLG